jgi:hypothetical protein
MAESFDRLCKDCNRPITMRQMWYGKWHAFDGQNRHDCLKQRTRAGLSGWKTILVCVLGLLLLMLLFRVR